MQIYLFVLWCLVYLGKVSGWAILILDLLQQTGKR